MYLLGEEVRSRWGGFSCMMEGWNAPAGRFDRVGEEMVWVVGDWGEGE